MEDGRIQDSQITTSGVASGSGTRAYGWQARLNKNISSYGAWCVNTSGGSGKYKKYDQYIQINLMNLSVITSIATQGGMGGKFVPDYKISYSEDSLSDWIFCRAIDQTSDEAKVAL